MKAYRILAASVVFAVSTTSFAQSFSMPDRVNSRYPDVQYSASVQTRVASPEVFARGSDRVNSRYPENQEAPASGTTRNEVHRELEQAKADGSYEVLHREYRN